MMKKLTFGIFLGSAVSIALAQSPVEPPRMAASMGLIAYPPEDITSEKVQEDDTHCYHWAVDYTGQDPLKVAADFNANQPAETHGGQAAAGAAAGATAGVLIGDNRESAAKGAAVGAVGGGIANNRQRRQQSAQQDVAQQQADASMDQFRMGFSSCLKSRGYSVAY